MNNAGISEAALAVLRSRAQAVKSGSTQRPVQMISLGLSAYDMVWSVNELPVGGGKIRATEFHEGGGGMAANAAVSAARLGAEVQFWGRAGNDRAGLAMADALAGEQVGVEHFRRFDQARSSISGVIVDATGERSIVNFRGGDLPTDSDWLPIGEVGNANVVLADPRWPQGATTLFEKARQESVPTVLDADVSDSIVFDELLPLVDYAIFSQPGLADYANASVAGTATNPTGDRQSDQIAQLEFARSRGCKIPTVTLGSQGVAWLDDGGFHCLPAINVNVVDTTGAGDTFHGAVSFAIGAGLGLHDAFAFANAVAAIKCTRAGGRAGSPDLPATLQFITKLEQTNE